MQKPAAKWRSVSRSGAHIARQDPHRPRDAADRHALTGRGRWSGWRLAIAILLAIPLGILGLVASDLVAWASSAGCPEGDRAEGLGIIALVMVVTGGVPTLVAGFRRIALVPMTLGAAGPALIFVVLFFTRENPTDCL